MRIGQSALVGTMSDVVHCYGGKGGATRQYSLLQPAPILCMALLATLTSRMTKGLILALANGGNAGRLRNATAASARTLTTPYYPLAAGPAVAAYAALPRDRPLPQARCASTTSARWCPCTQRQRP